MKLTIARTSDATAMMLISPLIMKKPAKFAPNLHLKHARVHHGWSQEYKDTSALLYVPGTWIRLQKKRNHNSKEQKTFKLALPGN